MTEIRARASSLTGFADIMRELGQDPDRLVAQVGLPPATLSEPDLMVPVARMQALLDAAVAATGHHDIGLRLGARRRLSSWGVVALVVREQPTLGDAIDVMGRYIVLQNEGARVSVVDGGEFAEIHLNSVRRDRHPGRQAVELGVALIYRALCEIMDGGWRPAGVAFRSPRPDNPQSHRALFACPMAFEQAFDGVLIPREDMRRPVPGADGALARQAGRLADQLLAQAPRSLSARVMELSILLLPGNGCTRERVADELGIGVRTLQRRLADEGASFAILLDEARVRLAARYVDESRRSLLEVADLLGFGSQAAFNHWYRAKHGQTPGARRRAAGHNRANSGG